MQKDNGTKRLEKRHSLGKNLNMFVALIEAAFVFVDTRE